MLASPPPSRVYSYTKISDLVRSQDKVNVLGVVTTFEAARKSRGPNYFCSLEIVDQSEIPVKCVFYNTQVLLLPSNCSAGDIICIRRITVTGPLGHLKLLSSRISSWLLFRRESSKIVPITSANSFTFTKEEKRCVQQLRSWVSSTSLLPPAVSSCSNPNTGPITQNTVSRTQQQLNNTSSVSPTAAESPSVNSPTSLHTEPAGTSTFTDSPSTEPSEPSSPTSKFISYMDFVCSSVPLYSDSNSQPLSGRNFQCRLVDIGRLTSGESKVGVCGIVKHFKPSTRSRGLDFFVTIALIDMSCPSKGLSCTLFNPSEQKLPKVHTVGDIVIVKGIKTGSYQGLLQARGHEHTLVGVIDADNDSPVPEGLGDRYKLSLVERSSIQSLKKWMCGQSPLLLNTKLEETSVGTYFNMVCRVAAISVFEPLRLAVLSVFDGTSPTFSCRSLDLSSSKYAWESYRDPSLLYTYQGLIYDVYVMDLESFTVSEGDYVSMVNVKAKSLSSTDSNSSTSLVDVEFYLTGQGLHKGAITVLPADSKTVTDWSACLPVPFGPMPVYVTQGDSPAQCVCEIIDEENTPTKSIEDVLQSPAKTKFVVEVQVENACPGPVEDMCQLRCSECKLKYSVGVDSRPLTAGDVCICCSNDESKGPKLQYMYVFKLRLRDQTGCLDVLVYEKDAEKFLSIGPPTNIYTNREARESLLTVLYQITGGNDPFYPAVQRSEFSYERPLLKVCVKRYTANNGNSCFQLVDTILNVVQK